MEENLRILNSKLRDALIEYYSRHGYKTNPDAALFEQSEASGSVGINFGPHAEYTSSFAYSPLVAITNNDVKASVESILGPSLRPTMLAGLADKRTANFMGSRAYDECNGYRLQTASDVAAIVAHHQTFMENVGWAFIKKMDIRGISEWLNANFFALSATMSEEEKIALIRRTGLHDASNGITAAWLANDTRRDQLIENYRTVFFPDHLRTKIDQLVEGLKKNTA